MATIGARLRAVFGGLFGSGGGGVVPWHLPRDARPAIQVNERTALTLTAVFRACSLLADATSSSPVVLYSRPASGGRVVDTTSAAARALATLSHADMELAAFQCALGGNGYLKIVRDGTGAPFELRAVPAWRVSLEVEDGGEHAIWYRIQPDPLLGEPEALVPEGDMVHLRFRVTSHRLLGTPPLASCAPAFALALQSRNVQRYLFENLATPGVVLVTPNKIEKDVARKLQTEFEQNYSAGGQGRTAVLSNGLDIKTFVWKAADQQLLEQINASTLDIARAYGVPRQFLEDQVTMTYASASEGTRALYALALRGFTTRVADAMSAKLISRNDRAAGAGVEFDSSDLLILPGEELSKFLGGLVSQGIISANEARNQWLKLPDAPGGDALRTIGPQPQAAKTWDPKARYPQGVYVVHRNGLWVAVRDTADEPHPDSPDWDCPAPGVYTVRSVGTGFADVELSNGEEQRVMQ